MSAPVTWDELTEVSPEDFKVTTMPERFRREGDVHADLATRRFGLGALLEMADRASPGAGATEE